MPLKDPFGVNPSLMNIRTNDVDTSGVGTPFDASSGGWTVSAGDIFKYQFYLLGNFVVVIFDLRNTTTTSLPSELLLNLPEELYLEQEGWCGSGQFDSPVPDSASTFHTAVLVGAHISRIKIERAGLGDFPNGSNNVNVRGFFMGPLEMAV